MATLNPTPTFPPTYTKAQIPYAIANHYLALTTALSSPLISALEIVPRSGVFYRFYKFSILNIKGSVIDQDVIFIGSKNYLKNTSTQKLAPTSAVGGVPGPVDLPPNNGVKFVKSDAGGGFVNYSFDATTTFFAPFVGQLPIKCNGASGYVTHFFMSYSLHSTARD